MLVAECEIPTAALAPNLNLARLYELIAKTYDISNTSRILSAVSPCSPKVKIQRVTTPAIRNWLSRPVP